jgi:hypothetical protein
VMSYRKDSGLKMSQPSMMIDGNTMTKNIIAIIERM